MMNFSAAAKAPLVAAIAATIGFAVPAHADPETDTTFLDAIGDEGITIPQPVNQAQAVCSALRAHPDQGIAGAAEGLVNNNPGLSDPAAAFFVGAAIGAYCPEFKPLVTAQ